MEFKPGQNVIVTDCYGKVLIRRVIEDLGKMVVLCTNAEFNKAVADRRRPEGVGFPVESVRIKSQ